MSLFKIPDRPRERLLAYGGERVSTAELLALILGTGLPGRSATALAQHIIHSIGGIVPLAQAAPRELVNIPGIGLARAARIAAAFHIGRRALEATAADADHMDDPMDLCERLRLRMSGLTQEVFVVVPIGPRGVILEEIEVARGCLTGVEVHPREVFRPLIRIAAAGAVVAHNHPSGDARPSREDIALTYRLREAGEVIGIPILDHIVIGASGCTSMYLELGLRERRITCRDRRTR
ncbi:MAG TPA: DNA repair protein RadC [Haliangium sp.]|nr:DNA repair protein RadC [Haliangium sp.]